METKELIDTLQVCADHDIICPACPRYEKYKYGGTAECYEKLMLEAADTIESQQKRIAELEAALREQEERRWIPVTERLPKAKDADKYGRVLVMELGMMSLVNYRGPINYPDKFPYWMPLPEPPKEDAP